MQDTIIIENITFSQVKRHENRKLAGNNSVFKGKRFRT